jgi:hypothetical protein
MRAIILAATLLAGIAGCTRSSEPATPAPQSTMEAVQQTPSKLLPEQTQRGLCPSAFTCDDINWFSTKAACQASAACSGGDCFRDTRCGGNCICP